MRLKDKVAIIIGGAHGTAEADVVSVAAALATQSAFHSRVSSSKGGLYRSVISTTANLHCMHFSSRAPLRGPAIMLSTLAQGSATTPQFWHIWWGAAGG